MGRWLLVFLGACDFAFQLDHIDEQPQVTGTFAWYSVENGEVVAGTGPSLGVELTLARGGGTTPIEVAGDGAFSFSAPEGERYRVVMQASIDPNPIEFVSTSRSLALARFVYGRRERTPVTQSTAVTFNVMSAMPTTGFGKLASTGIRTFSDASSVLSAQVDWLGAGVFDNGAVGLLDAGLGDVLYYNHFIRDTTQQYIQLAEFAMNAATLRDGQPYTAAVVAAIPVMLNHCVNLVAPRQRELDRVLALHGVSTVPPATDWAISSVPVREVGPGGALRLAYNGTSTNDEDRDVNYGTPYTGESEVASMQVLAYRNFQVPGTTTPYIATTATVAIYKLESTTCPGMRVDLGSEYAPLMTASALGDTALTEDNQPVMISRDGPIVYSFALGEGSYTDSVVTLYELVVDAGNRTGLRTVRQYLTVDSSVDIDPVLLVKNRRYAFAVTARRQYASPAQGNYRDQIYPVLLATSFSSWFQIGS